MGNKHNNLKRIIHRATEEINSTFKVSYGTSITNFTKIISAKTLNYKLNKAGKPESKKDTDCLLCKHNILMQYFEKGMEILRIHIFLMRKVYRKIQTLEIKYGFVGGRELNRLRI